MGSLWGHIDEGMFFVGIAIWWIYRMFKDYIQADQERSTFRSQTSYPWSYRGRLIPLEIYIKLFIVIGGFMIEVVSSKMHFIDENGDFKHVSGLQHMSIFMLFMLHVLIDLGQFYNVMNIRDLNYITAALAFFWYGTVFIFHSFMNDILEKLVHVIGVVLCYGAAAGILWEYGSRDTFVPNYFRNLMILTLGTWFTHMPFYLFSNKGFPGNGHNPKWDRDSMNNFEFAATMLGIHLFVNIIVTLIIYVLVKLCNRNKAPSSVKTVNGGFKLLPMQGEDDEEKGRLLCSDDEETSSLT